MEEILIYIAEYGIQTVIIVILGYYILKKETDYKESKKELLQSHLQERSEWREQINKQWETMENLQRETNDIIRQHTSVIAEFKGLLKSSH